MELHGGNRLVLVTLRTGLLVLDYYVVLWCVLETFRRNECLALHLTAFHMKISALT